MIPIKFGKFKPILISYIQHIMSTKKERKKKKIKEKEMLMPFHQKLHYEEHQIPPYSQEHLRSLFLEYCSHDIFQFPMHHENIMKKIKSFYQNIQNSEIYMNELNLKQILADLAKMNVVKAGIQALGTRPVMFVQRVNRNAIIQLAEQYRGDRPMTPPPDPITFKQQRLMLPEEQKKKENEIKNAYNVKSLFGDKNTQLFEHISFEQMEKAQQFKNKGNQQTCNYCTRDKCMIVNGPNCRKKHFRVIITANTDQSMGNCPHLNACHNPDCKHIHYAPQQEKKSNKAILNQISSKALNQCEWVNCDMRTFDFTVLGKYDVIMADPPWDIHMNLPYGTMKDKEMLNLRVDLLQDHGVIFLWVTGRAMELGRECLERWGYKRIDQLVWIKTNQIQRLIITGKTGHWLNHSKEHCLVGIKGNPKINVKLDCDVLVSQVRQTSRKPDEIYGIIERMHPGGRKIELFGRPQNCMPGWCTLGNQLPGVFLNSKQVINRYKRTYPEQNLTEQKMKANMEAMNIPQNHNLVYNNHLLKNN